MTEESSSIVVMFNCNRCGLRAVKVTVNRRREDQKITEWADYAAARCGFKHQVLSPNCPSRKLDLMIPIPKPGDALGRSIDPDKNSENAKDWADAVNRSKLSSDPFIK